MKELYMPTGTVKWFDESHGFGFILPDDGSEEVFAHRSVVEKSGLQTLRTGQKVEYEIVATVRRKQVQKLHLIKD